MLSVTADVECGGFEGPIAAANTAGFRAVSTAAGFLSIIVSKVRAGASGVLLPQDWDGANQPV